MKNPALRFCLILCMLLVATAAFGFGKSDILIQRYRAAHEAKDVEALKELVYWDGALERTRQKILGRLTQDLDLKISEIEFKPLKPDESFETSQFKPSLEPAGWLAITFENPKGGKYHRSKVFVVGEKDGQYLITVAKPVK